MGGCHECGRGGDLRPVDADDPTTGYTETRDLCRACRTGAPPVCAICDERPTVDGTDYCRPCGEDVYDSLQDEQGFDNDRQESADLARAMGDRR
ncbi:MAG: hypothetical protein AB7P99_04740 [Vicinamibacterales bacterium]